MKIELSSSIAKKLKTLDEFSDLGRDELKENVTELIEELLEQYINDNYSDNKNENPDAYEE
jgi:HEPN domain-containing protein